MAREPTSNPPEGRWPLILRRADQVTVVTLAVALFAMLVGHWVLGLVVGHGLIEIDRAPPCRLEYRVRLNDVDWTELTLLPGIGETLARRIVADRTRNGRYESLDQLERVKGIGPKTVRRIRPFVEVP